VISKLNGCAHEVLSNMVLTWPVLMTDG